MRNYWLRIKASVVNGEKRCQSENPDILGEDSLETRPGLAAWREF
jgi:hypothetical protein